MIELITRIQSPKLYERMKQSALGNAYGPFEASWELDTVSLPRCAETYNRLAAKSKADILCFIEDDVELLTKDWNRIVEEIFLEYEPDILGVVGASEYNGGGYFEAGNKTSFGLIACNKSKHEQETYVRILSPHYRYKKVKVIDGMLMFCKRDFWKKEPFDEKSFDELFYYDIDLCLKSDKVAITCDLLAKHSKPAEFYGKYPPKMKPASHYDKILMERHNLVKKPVQNQMCCLVSMETFKKHGQTESFRNFERRYACALA